MDLNLGVGLRGEAGLLVSAGHTADAGGQGAAGLQVLGTPHLIGLLEQAAWNAVQPLLPEGLVSVGSCVIVRHLSATPPGMAVTAHAELVRVDGRRLHFRLWAEDAVERISEGEHERVVLPLARLLERAAAKSRSRPG